MSDAVRRLGPAARVLLVVRHGETGRAVDDLLRFVCELGRLRSRTLLLDLDGRDSPLPAALDVPPAPGLTDVLARRARMVDVAVRDPDRPFLYVPPGHAEAASDDVASTLARSGLLSTARERGATVLLHVAAGAPGPATGGASGVGVSEAAAIHADGAILVGGDDEEAARCRPPVLARIPERSQGSASALSTRGLESREPSAGARRRWPASAPVGTPPASRRRDAVRSDLVLDHEGTVLRTSGPRWWVVVLVCALAAALGLSILSAVSEDSWFRDLYQGGSEARSVSTR